MQIKHFDTLPEDAVFIRKEVFVKEQGFKNEFDEKDNEAHFLVGYENGSPVATCRIFYDTTKRDRKSTRLNSSHPLSSRMPSSA